MKIITIILLAIALTGCATNDYERYALMQESIAASESRARIAEAKVAEAAVTTGGDIVKAVGLLRFGANGQAKSAVVLQPPRSFSETVFQWAGLLVPSIVQGYGIHANMRTNMNASDNATALGISTNNAFVGMAGQIQSPAASITTNTSIGGNGVIGSGSYEANPIATTLSGTGVLGSGTYSTQANPISNANRNCTGSGAGSGSSTGTTTPQTGSGGSGSANC